MPPSPTILEHRPARTTVDRRRRSGRMLYESLRPQLTRPRSLISARSRRRPPPYADPGCSTCLSGSMVPLTIRVLSLDQPGPGQRRGRDHRDRRCIASRQRRCPARSLVRPVNKDRQRWQQVESSADDPSRCCSLRPWREGGPHWYIDLLGALRGGLAISQSFEPVQAVACLPVAAGSDRQERRWRPPDQPI